MTPAYFENTEALTFLEGQLIVVSGPDNGMIALLLSNTQTAIQGSGKGCLDPIDTRTTIAYPTGLVSGTTTPTTTTFTTADFFFCYQDIAGFNITMTDGPNIGVTRTIASYNENMQFMTLTAAFLVAPAVGNGFLLEVPDERSHSYEFLAIQNRALGPTPKVVLIGNKFDRTDVLQNPKPIDMQIDVVTDLLHVFNVKNILDVGSLIYPGTRSLFSYISKVYYYDTRISDITFVKDQIPYRP